MSKLLSPPLAHYGTYLKVLRVSLAIGGIYDLLLAVLLAVAPGLPFGLLALPLPGEPFYLGLLVVLVAMVAALYLLAAYDPMAYAGNVLVAIGGRLTAGVMMAWMAAGRDDLSGLYILAAVDLAFGVIHAVTWLPCRHLRAQLL